MPRNPLAEVFGYPVGSTSEEAINHRQGRLCPYNNPSGLNCTKYSVTDPLGVCSIFDGDSVVVTCPVRLRQDALLLRDAAAFFFHPDQHWVALTEVRLNDGHGKLAGNIDIVLAVLDDNHRVVDFGAIEVQAVYISGNVSQPFRQYMQTSEPNRVVDWPRRDFPRPDYLSSSRKRLAPQLMFKGKILHAWGKKIAVAVQTRFFEQLPALVEVPQHEAELAWLLYDLRYEPATRRYRLYHVGTKYTRFQAALETITTPVIGDVSQFLDYLGERIRRKQMAGTPMASPLEPTVEPLPSENARGIQ